MLEKHSRSCSLQHEGIYQKVIKIKQQSNPRKFDWSGFQYILSCGTGVLTAYLLLRLFIEKVLKQNLDNYLITKFYLKKEWIAIGILLPSVVLILLYVLIPGNIVSNNFSLDRKLSQVLNAIFITGLLSGIIEELIFRGLIMNTVSKEYGRKLGILIPSILFRALHILNGEIDLVSALLLIFGGSTVGIMFSLLASRYQTIWASMIVHAFWNASIVGGLCTFGIRNDPNAIISYVFERKDLILTGGSYGVELSILGYSVVVIFLILEFTL
ncbi:MAG: CPBP family intramembrane glutamic endopeptidase [Enterococcus sp.]